MKFEEGEYHDFFVVKEVSLPEEGVFYLLRHKSGRRLMLPVDTYRNYNISANTTLKCRIDKVSCTGKVYLEPIHPRYKEGKIYSFKLVNVTKEKNLITLEDIYGNLIHQELNSNDFVIQNTIRMKVLRIKKGIPQLAFPDKAKKDVNLNSLLGKKKEFIIKGLAKNYENEEVYHLESLDGFKSQLKEKHYKHYRLNGTDKILCVVYGFNDNGILKVEPQNPYYSIGEVYEFEVDEIKGYSKDYEDVEDILIVKDYFGNKCGVSINIQEYKKIKIKTRITCRVNGFRKGRPRLEMII